jgi:hypothetical protein
MGTFFSSHAFLKEVTYLFLQKVTKRTKELARCRMAQHFIFSGKRFENERLEHPSFSSFPSVQFLQGVAVFSRHGNRRSDLQSRGPGKSRFVAPHASVI